MMKIKKILKNEEGNTLVFVLVTLVVASILAMTVIFLADTNFRVANKEEKNSQAYYIARTGADALAQYIAVNPDGKDTGKILEELAEKGESQSEKFGDGEFKVKVKQDEKQKKAGFYEITSTGKQGKEAVVASVIMAPIQTKDVFNNGTMVSLSSLSIDKHTNIEGPIASNGSITNKNDDIKPENLKPYSELSFPEPQFPEEVPPNSEIVINGNCINSDQKAEKITLKGNINIKTPQDKDIIIHAKNLTIDGESKITVDGLGKVYFYVEESATIGREQGNKGAEMKVETNSYLLLYLKAGANLRIIGDPGKKKDDSENDFNGYIYGPSANLFIEKGTKITGFIIANKIEIDGNHHLISPIEGQTQDNINIDLGINLGYKKDVWKK